MSCLTPAGAGVLPARRVPSRGGLRARASSFTHSAPLRSTAAPPSGKGGRRGRRAHVHPTTPRAAAVRLTFDLVEGASANARVVGEHPALGSWNADGGLRQGDVVEVDSLRGGSLEYKWHDGTAWEEGENRTLHLPDSGDDGSVLTLTVVDRGVRFVPQEPAPAASVVTNTHQHQHQHQPPPRDHRRPEPQPAPSHAPGPMEDEASRENGGPPLWYREAVVYSIQTLGFCGCEGPPSQFTHGERLARLVDDGWLEHMARLGCNVLYLGPLMKTSEDLGHGYDTADYFEVDPRLGSMATLRRVVDVAHSLQIRVIVDGVFNHTGRDHFAARDVLQNGSRSQYWDWYYARETDSGVELEGWEGHVGLPRLNHANPAVRAHIIDVGRFWMSPEGANIDGWRLDVAHEVAPDFWREFSRACRDAKPNCALLGELMHGDYNTHVGPDLLDSGTNYQLSKSLWSSLNDANYWELAHCYQRDLDMYGGLTLLNFLGNHDQMRIHSRLNNPRAHYVLASASMLLARGVPCVYYGDEMGEEGKPGGPDGDLAMRRPVNLASALSDPARMAFIKATSQLISLRRSHEALRDASSAQIPLGHTNTTMAFARVASSGAAAIVAFNCEDKPASMTLPVSEKIGGVGDGVYFSEPLAGESSGLTVSGGSLTLDLPPNGYRVLVRA